jgi:hypothetical protein
MNKQNNIWDLNINQQRDGFFESGVELNNILKV